MRRSKFFFLRIFREEFGEKRSNLWWFITSFFVTSLTNILHFSSASLRGVFAARFLHHHLQRAPIFINRRLIYLDYKIISYLCSIDIWNLSLKFFLLSVDWNTTHSSQCQLRNIICGLGFLWHIKARGKFWNISRMLGYIVRG